ncbi:MAG TPA: hypothetical protein VJK51_04290 [Candidatus Nanoarchaeia archaeon]|nr:hypothetical protein [Candidatus Nanoarchaeia archaeon]
MIKRFTIPLAHIHPYEDGGYERKIKETLDEKDLLGNDFLYTIVDGKRTAELKKNGTYREGKTIYALTQDQLIWTSVDYNSNPLEKMAQDYDHPAIAIWHKTKFKLKAKYEFVFKDPDKKPEALIAIAQLKLAA